MQVSYAQPSQRGNATFQLLSGKPHIEYVLCFRNPEAEVPTEAPTTFAPTEPPTEATEGSTALTETTTGGEETTEYGDYTEVYR